MKKIFAGLVLLLLTSCIPPSGPPPVKFDRVALSAQLAELPGVRVSPDAELQFSYPAQSLFGFGAVLPLPGGTRLLDPLAAFLLRNPGLRWQVDVQVKTEYGTDYDQTLAEKRSELLATYLLIKGVDLGELQFQPAAATVDALVFTLDQAQKTVKQ